VARVLAVVGFITTAISIVLACIPAADEPNKALAVAKIVGLSGILLAIGAAVYVAGRRRGR
jgi:glutamate:GABA antiporter